MRLNVEELENFKRELLTRFDKEAGLLLKTSHAKIILNPRMRSTGGRARYSRNSIELNVRLLSENPDQIKQVFAHELAHLLSVELFGLTRGRGHKRAWRNVMRRLGYEPRRTHSMDTRELRHGRGPVAPVAKAQCGCMTHNLKPVRYKKMLQGVKYSCKRCKTGLVLT